jgi:hypothetical protein
MKIINKAIYKITRTFKKEAEVVPPTYEKKREIIESYRGRFDLRILIETGTFFGDTVEYFKHQFKRIYSIELAHDLARRAQERFINDPNVKIIQGDSGAILQTLIKEINEPVLFWLDGHYSSEFFVGDEFIKTARANKDTPIEEEMISILSTHVEHIILIDDARLFNGLDDYPSIRSLNRKVRKAKGKNYTCKVENDIIQIFPSKTT